MFRLRFHSHAVCAVEVLRFLYSTYKNDFCLNSDSHSDSHKLNYDQNWLCSDTIASYSYMSLLRWSVATAVNDIYSSHKFINNRIVEHCTWCIATYMAIYYWMTISKTPSDHCTLWYIKIAEHVTVYSTQYSDTMDYVLWSNILYVANVGGENNGDF